MQSTVPVDEYIIPALSEPHRNGLTPHTNLILDFFLANPSIVMGFQGAKALQGRLDLKDSRLAWGAAYLLAKLGLLSRVPGHRLVITNPRTAAQLRALTRVGRWILLRSTELVPGWHDLERRDCPFPGRIPDITV